MTIPPFAAGNYNTALNAQRMLASKSSLDTLTTQMASGRTAETYGGLGASRTLSLSANAQVARLEGYGTNITTALNRINLGSKSLQTLATTTSTLATSIANGMANTSSPAARNTTRLTAASNLDLFVDTLNQNYNGTYLFGGRATEAPPVASADSILNGDASGAGLKAVIAERKTADGTAGTGNLGISAPTGTPATTITLSEGGNAANRANFGFILGAVTSSNSTAIGSAVVTAAAAPTADLTFGTQPKDGDVVRVSVNQADGSQAFVDYTARTVATGAANEFVIGADATASATALKTALGTSKIAAAQSQTPPGVAVSFTGGAAASTALTVNGLPNDGDTVTVTLGLRDGTKTTLTLTARTTSDGTDPSVFVIGADAATTATNLQAALSSTVQGSATTTLAASSAVLAAKDFFAGTKSAAFAPRRVDATNGGFLSNPAGKTMIWYKGDESLTDPRGTATAQVSSGLAVDIGAQANEAGIRNAITGVAILASEQFASTKSLSDTTLSAADRTQALNERNRYTAMADRVTTLFKPAQDDQGITQVAAELSLASAQIGNAKTQNGALRAQFQNTIDGTQLISTEEVATKILSVQSQLQASYQVTSMLSKLSLVNFL
ncbi:hypothetical protein PMNALOAF_2370 [Methylobacterium adhaesivum]|uniref:Flagellin N-terminal domain-containing protein n=1 Tax=Methylobacterium adhaesivum TaxID=333297 RepID=A0ABT8BJ87_9HYPH|nr:hypothetical protein [Methylobacterium adhaesivum]MDN3591560.1 hypothetical protein [Methylobacterium adhaesivum]GJD31117.1 hypothetical protein PMNALOAF_2370 [Methylobacterium adhaesivum]